MPSQSFAANIFVRFCSDRLRDLCPEWLRDFHPYEVIRLLVAANNGPAAACLIIMQSNTAVLHIRFLELFCGTPCTLQHCTSDFSRFHRHMTYLCEKSKQHLYFIFLDEIKKIVDFYCKLCLIEFFFVLSARELVSCASAYVNNSNIVLSKLNCCQTSRKSALPNQKFSLCVCLSF